MRRRRLERERSRKWREPTGHGALDGEDFGPGNVEIYVVSFERECVSNLSERGEK